MRRHGRGFPLGTSYQSLMRTVPTNPMSGAGTMTMSGVGALSLVSGTVFVSTELAEHRFRSVQVPPMDDLEAVRRQIQQALDEVARAVNPLRSVADGGTGLDEVSDGAIMYGTGAGSLATLPKGTNGQVLGIVAGQIAWQAAGGGGEVNTGSNVNVGGVGVFKQKTVVNLEFRGVAALAASSLVVALDAANNKIDFSLSGDLAAPGNTKLYGTDGAGVKGWFAQPVPLVWTEVEVDFGGGAGLRHKTFTIADAAVSGTSKIICAQSGQAPTGKPADDLAFDALLLRAKPGAGTFDLYVDAADGFLINKYKILYAVA